MSAAAPGRVYLLRKLIRRHKGPFAMASVVLVLLLAGFAATGWQALRATRETRRAIAAEQLAGERLQEATEFSQLLTEVLEEQMIGYWALDEESARLSLERSRKDLAMDGSASPLSQELLKLAWPLLLSRLVVEIREGEFILTSPQGTESSSFTVAGCDRENKALTLELESNGELSRATVSGGKLFLQSEGESWVLVRIGKQEFETRLRTIRESARGQ